MLLQDCFRPELTGLACWAGNMQAVAAMTMRIGVFYFVFRCKVPPKRSIYPGRNPRPQGSVACAAPDRLSR